MGQTQGGNAGNLELLRKVEELERREKFHAGDAIQNIEAYMAGDVTSGNTSLRLQLMLPKQIDDDVNSIRLTSTGFFTVRGHKGYVGGLSSSDNVKMQDLHNLFDNLSITFFRQIGYINLLIAKSLGFENIEANTPVVGNVWGLTIEFL